MNSSQGGDPSRINRVPSTATIISPQKTESFMSFFRPNIDDIEGYVPGEQPQETGWIKLNTNENAWPPPRVYPVPAFDRSLQRNPSDAIQAGAYDVTDVDQPTYDRINARYGLHLKMRMKAFLQKLSNN